jgi:hypothetical protein
MPNPAHASIDPLPPITRETLNAAWEAISAEEPRIFRMQISPTGTSQVTMALGAALRRSAVHMFAVEKIDVHNGHVRIVAADPGQSMEIRIEGDGGAFDTGEGRMKAVVSLDSRPATKFAPTRWTVLFVAGRKLLKTVSSLSAELGPDLPAVAMRVVQRMKQVGFDGLTIPEQHFAMVWELDASVTNGGFERYFRSPASDRVAATLRVLETILARRGVVHLRDALTVFGKAGPAPNRGERERQLQQLSEAAKTHLRGCDKWWGLDHDDLVMRLELYAASHPEVARPAAK